MTIKGPKMINRIGMRNRGRKDKICSPNSSHFEQNWQEGANKELTSAAN